MINTNWLDKHGNPYTLDGAIRYLTCPYESIDGHVMKRKIDRHRVREIQQKYGIRLPKGIKHWISIIPENEMRIIDAASIIPYQSILNPYDFCEVDFVSLKKLPLIGFWNDVYGCYCSHDNEIISYPYLLRSDDNMPVNGLSKTEANLIQSTIFHINLDIAW